jgi:hypothetical protein
MAEAAGLSGRTHPASVDELIGDEVERPTLIRPLRDRDGRPRAPRSLGKCPDLPTWIAAARASLVARTHPVTAALRD